MVLIADSGSTKCDWLLRQDNQLVFKTSTAGLNPHILSVKQLRKVIKTNRELMRFCDQIERIYFFGAGCGTSKNQERIKALLERYFQKAQVRVYEDLMAAVWAVNKVPSVLCILGTGSNSTYFDGLKLSSKVPSLGYLVMDEGSGNSLGRRMLRAYYYKQMPAKLAVEFESKFNLDSAHVVDKLYSSKTPNRYLAKFARFAVEHRQHAFIASQIRREIELFVEYHVLVYKEELVKSKLYFVGSVAYYLQDFISDELAKYGYKVAEFIRRPIEQILAKANQTSSSN